MKRRIEPPLARRELPDLRARGERRLEVPGPQSGALHVEEGPQDGRREVPRIEHSGEVAARRRDRRAERPVHEEPVRHRRQRLAPGQGERERREAVGQLRKRHDVEPRDAAERARNGPSGAARRGAGSGRRGGPRRAGRPGESRARRRRAAPRAASSRRGRRAGRALGPARADRLRPIGFQANQWGKARATAGMPSRRWASSTSNSHSGRVTELDAGARGLRGRDTTSRAPDRPGDVRAT